MRGVQTFAVYADWHTPQPIDDAVLAAASRSFRTEDETVCVWISERDPSVLAFSIDVAAQTLEEAANIGRSYFESGSLPTAVTGRLAQVVAMDDERQFVWQNSA
jgi:hypothetical protein